jgi:two-component system, NtrC family, sensor kinase
MAFDYLKYPVLYVDDEEANRIIFRAAFSKDFQILLASNAQEALSVVRETMPAVMIIDQRMPGMSGIELAEIIRNQYPDIVRIIITAYTDIQVAIDAINRGQVSLYLSKPWNSVEVRSYLKNAIERRYLGQYVQDLQSKILRTERLATLGMAASSIAHDMGTPVACLLNDLDGMDRELEELRQLPNPDQIPLARLDEFHEMVLDCKTSVEEIARILLAVRHSIKGTSVHLPVNLCTVIQTGLKLIQTEVVHKASLSIHCCDEILVLGDASELTQIVINLAVNAAHAIPYGHQSENRVEVSVSTDEQFAVLKVRDTGCGIPPELRSKIFEPLFTTRAEEGGTGLGLSIIRRIVETHNGTIDLDSVVGKGTVFTVKLPLAL